MRIVSTIRDALRSLPAGTGHTAPERRVAFVRLLVLFSLLPLLWWDVIAPESEIALTGLTVLIAAYIVAALLILPRLRRAPRQDLFLTIDILAVTTLVYYTGGVKSSLLFLLYLPILSAAVRFDLRHTFLSAVAVSAMVVWLWSVTEGGLLSLGAAGLRVGLFTFGSFLVASIFGILAQETRLSQERAVLGQTLNLRLEEATRELWRKIADLEFFYDVSRRLAAATETATILETVTDAAASYLGAPISAVFLAERDGRSLSIAHVQGTTIEAARPVMHACTQQLLKVAAAPQNITADGDGRWVRGVAVPIVAGDHVIGVLCAGGDAQWAGRRQTFFGLATIAGQCGVALERAFALEDLQRLAHADPAMRLFGQTVLDRMVREEIRRATQLGVPFALLKLGVGPRAPAADQTNHHADLSKQVAGKIFELTRRIDVVALGKDGAFFVLRPMTDAESASRFASVLHERLLGDQALRTLMAEQDGAEIQIGIASFPDDATTGPELIYAAQNALDNADPQIPIVRAGELDTRIRPAEELEGA